MLRDASFFSFAQKYPRMNEQTAATFVSPMLRQMKNEAPCDAEASKDLPTLGKLDGTSAVGGRPLKDGHGRTDKRPQDQGCRCEGPYERSQAWTIAAFLAGRQSLLPLQHAPS